MSSGWRVLCSLCMSSLLIVGCKTEVTTQTGLVGINREQRMAISETTMTTAANKQYAQVMADARKKEKLNVDAE